MFEYELPDVGEGVAEGEIVAWHVEPGDRVQEDDVLAEIETDKAVVDLPAPVSGVIRELHADVGEVVPVGDVVVTIEPDEETHDDEATTDSDVESDDEAVEPGPSPGDGRVFAPPHVRRLARELGLDVVTIEGSGPGGRVTERDVRSAAGTVGAPDEAVEAAIEEVDSGEAADAATGDRKDGTDGRTAAIRKVGGDEGDAGKYPSARGSHAADRERTLAVPATRRVARDLGVDVDDVPTDKTRDGEPYVEPDDVEAYAEAQQAAQAADAATVSASPSDEGRTPTAPEPAAGERETREPYRGVRRSIGKRMEESVYTAPHVTHHDTAVVDELVAAREAMQPRAEERGVRLTYMPFVLKAVVAGLKDHPVLNTSLDEDSEEVVYKHYYDVGVATATDAGLMVPVVEAVDELGLLELASRIDELTAKVRDRSISRDELQGSTFTVTNFGAIGGEYATPIINYPETAILGLGAIEQRPVVEDGEVVARHTLPLSLSIDHRVIDGADAARFANTVIEYLETPSLLLLE